MSTPGLFASVIFYLLTPFQGPPHPETPPPPGAPNQGMGARSQRENSLLQATPVGRPAVRAELTVARAALRLPRARAPTLAVQI